MESGSNTNNESSVNEGFTSFNRKNILSEADGQPEEYKKDVDDDKDVKGLVLVEKTESNEIVTEQASSLKSSQPNELRHEEVNGYGLTEYENNPSP